MKRLNTEFKPTVEQLIFIIVALEDTMATKKKHLTEMIKEPRSDVNDRVMGFILGDYFKAATLIGQMQISADGSPIVDHLTPTQDELATLQTLIDEHSHPELATVEGHVMQVWNDGEVTSQKAGDLLWHRTLHTSEQGFPGIKYDVVWPGECSANGYIFTDGKGVKAVRQAILNLTVALIERQPK